MEVGKTYIILLANACVCHLAEDPALIRRHHRPRKIRGEIYRVGDFIADADLREAPIPLQLLIPMVRKLPEGFNEEIRRF